MKTAVLMGNNKLVFGVSVRQFLQERHMKVLAELSNLEISWQRHGGSLSLIRQQPLTEQRFVTNKNEQMFHCTYMDNAFFLSLFWDYHPTVYIPKPFSLTEAVSDSVIPSIRTASSSVLRLRDLLRRLLLW